MSCQGARSGRPADGTTNPQKQQPDAGNPFAGPPTNQSSTSSFSEEWSRILPAVYERRHATFVSYAVGCMRNSRYLGMDTSIEPEDLVQQAITDVIEGNLSDRPVDRCDVDDDNLAHSLLNAISKRCSSLEKQKRRRARLLPRGRDLYDPVNHVDADIEAASILLRTRIDSALARLPAMRRKTIERLVLDDQQAAVVAVEMDKSVKTLRNHRNLAIHSLRTELADHGPVTSTVCSTPAPKR
jgi:DNA-directed RNA polymerase specialized sigma24 family protein